MKCLIVASAFAPETGDAAYRLTELAAALRETGIETEVLAPLPNYPTGKVFPAYRHKSYCRETIRGIAVYRYPVLPSRSVRPLFRLPGMLFAALALWGFGAHRRRIIGYDFVLIQSPPLLSAISALYLFGKLYKKKILLNVSDLWPLTPAELGKIRPSHLAYRLAERMERYLYRHATAVMGQSEEILNRIRRAFPEKPLFLYRNLRRETAASGPGTAFSENDSFCKLKIVYAGLLGRTQDLLSLLRRINFTELKTELHLYGEGNQRPEIEKFIREHPGRSVRYCGLLPKPEMNRILPRYDAALIPLSVPLTGAVPSKLFDAMAAGLPVLFCGGGEGAEIVRRHGIGFVSPPGNFRALENNIRALAALSRNDRNDLSKRCLDTARQAFDFKTQFEEFLRFVKRMR